MSADHPHENHSPNDNAGTAPWNAAGSVRGDTPPAGRGHPRVPDAIARRYLRVDNRYFFPDRALAFIDDGGRIRVHTENREVLHGVVAIAEARGWQVIELRGTDAFRQGMWREAAMRGMAVLGYKPTQAEILQVQRALRGWQPSHETGRGSTLGPPDRERPGTAAPEDHSDRHPTQALQDDRSPRKVPRSPVRGMFVAAAAAPYAFDPAQRMSFYVMVRTEVGDRTIWGTDLERALAESSSQPRIGDQVVLTHLGTRPVDVRVAARNAEGELVGERKIVAQRARWSVETPDHVRAMEGRAMHVRTGELPSDATRSQHPELATAAAALRLADQYARRVTGDQASQLRLVQLIRERMADALEQGRSLHLPDRRLRPAPTHLRQRTARSLEELSHERA